MVRAAASAAAHSPSPPASRRLRERKRANTGCELGRCLADLNLLASTAAGEKWVDVSVPLAQRAASVSLSRSVDGAPPLSFSPEAKPCEPFADANLRFSQWLAARGRPSTSASASASTSTSTSTSPGSGSVRAACCVRAAATVFYGYTISFSL